MIAKVFITLIRNTKMPLICWVTNLQQLTIISRFTQNRFSKKKKTQKELFFLCVLYTLLFASSTFGRFRYLTGVTKIELKNSTQKGFYGRFSLIFCYYCSQSGVREGLAHEIAIATATPHTTFIHFSLTHSDRYWRWPNECFVCLSKSFRLDCILLSVTS